MTTGEKIRDLRKKANMSQDAFAEALDVSRQAVSKWENNETKPDAAKLILISELFHVSIDYLFQSSYYDSIHIYRSQPHLPFWYRRNNCRICHCLQTKKETLDKTLRFIAPAFHFLQIPDIDFPLKYILRSNLEFSLRFPLQTDCLNFRFSKVPDRICFHRHSKDDSSPSMHSDSPASYVHSILTIQIVPTHSRYNRTDT